MTDRLEALVKGNRKLTDRDARAKLPTSLAEVLTCSTSIMSTHAKVLLIALVYRWVKDKDTRSLPVRIQDVAFALGEHRELVAQAAVELHKLDYIDKDRDTVKLIKGQEILRAPEKFFEVPGLRVERIGEFVEFAGELPEPEKVKPKQDDEEPGYMATNDVTPRTEDDDDLEGEEVIGEDVAPPTPKKKASKKASKKSA